MEWNSFFAKTLVCAINTHKTFVKKWGCSHNLIKLRMTTASILKWPRLTSSFINMTFAFGGLVVVELDARLVAK